MGFIIPNRQGQQFYNLEALQCDAQLSDRALRYNVLIGHITATMPVITQQVTEIYGKDITTLNGNVRSCVTQ